MQALITSLFIVNCAIVFAQTPGEWTWMSGDSIPNSSGVFGIQGVADSSNKPPGLYQSCSWTDLDGDFWLFGGANFTSQGGLRPYNALWKYQPASNEWIWIKGSNVPFSFGIYGTKGVPDNDNTPGARYMASSWVDTSGNLWMFGGYGFDNGYNGIGIMNDLWKYDIASNQWTWLNGDETAYPVAHYGIKNVSDPLNTPNGRAQANSWTDHDSKLWLFGGFLHYSLTYYNDLWIYNIISNEWTWVNGDSLSGQPGSIGTLGLADSNNNPSARTCQAHWVDSSGSLWMFGGYAGSVAKDDLWEYIPEINMWIWWGGTLPGIPQANNGILCITDTLNSPTAREQTSFCQVLDNLFWMFGGYGGSLTYGNIQSHNDLWKLDYQSKIWVRINGVDYDVDGDFGQKGISSPTNSPHSRYGGTSWNDFTGSIWVFGGSHFIFSNFQSDCYNDLWRFVPDSTCGVYTSTNEITTNKNAIEVYPNPVTDVLYVFSSSPQKSTLTIFNSMGQVVLTKDFLSNDEVGVSKRPSGIYLVKVSSLGDCTTLKLVITK